MKKFSQWKESEVKKLFSCIEKAKSNNRSLLDGFREYAKKTKRKANSVRNYYYLEIENLKNNPERAKRMGVDLSIHDINRSEKFTLQETENLIMEILRLKCLGYSIRKACLKLGNNSVEEMLRFQNKFRNVMKSNRVLYNKCITNLRKQGLSEPLKNPIKNENVVYMKRPEEKKLSEEDVNSLFLGLVKLVKKSALENIEKKLIEETDIANSTLRRTLVKVSSLEKIISEREEQLKKIEEKVKSVLEENFSLKNKIANLMGEKIVKHSKNKSLTKYLKGIKEKGLEVRTKI